MPTSLVKTLIIGALLALLSGCSALRLAYNNGPLAAWWWLDGYIDFPSDQAPRAKAAIDQLFDRTRGADLPQLAALLAAAQAEVLEPTTPAQVCRWQRQFRERLDPIVDRGVLLAADLVGGLGEPQWRHLERQFEKKNADMRDDFLQPDRDERLARSVERTVERAEMLYGRLGDAQKRVIAAGVAASPFDPQAWIAERERRQRDTLQTLRRLTAERADRGDGAHAGRAHRDFAGPGLPHLPAAPGRVQLCVRRAAAQRHHAGAAPGRARAAQDLGRRPARTGGTAAVSGAAGAASAAQEPSVTTTVRGFSPWRGKSVSAA